MNHRFAIKSAFLAAGVAIAAVARKQGHAVAALLP